MSDLISRSEMLEHIDRRIQSIDIAPDPLYRIAWEIIRDYIEYEAPTIDAVPVVRCKDCANSYHNGREGTRTCRKFRRMVGVNSYCSCGITEADWEEEAACD